MSLLNILKWVNKREGITELKTMNIANYIFMLGIFLRTNNLEIELLKQIEKYVVIPNLDWNGTNEPHTKIFVTSELLKETLLNVYPKFGIIKGKYYPLITGDIDKLFEDYAKKIGYSVEVHKEIMDIVQWAKDNEMLNIGIEKFILSYYWESLKELKDKQIDITTIANDF